MTKDEALKLALKALEYHTAQTRPIHQTKEAITAIKEALAQPEQEPFMASYEFKQYGYYKDGKGTLKLGNIPATQPPQRTWVGLTDEEILEKCESVPDYDIGNYDLIQFARAIEAKLRSKND